MIAVGEMIAGAPPLHPAETLLERRVSESQEPSNEKNKGPTCGLHVGPLLWGDELVGSVEELLLQSDDLGRGVGMAEALGLSVEFDGLSVVGRHNAAPFLVAEAQGVAGAGVGPRSRIQQADGQI